MNATSEAGGDQAAVGGEGRLPAEGMTQLRHRISAVPAELAGARKVIREWAARVRLSRTRLDRLLLAVGEAIGNAMEHAYLGMRRGVIDLYLDLDGAGRLTGWVRDYGRWRESDTAAEAVRHRGRGLSLIRGVMDQVEVVRDQDGTTVRFSDAGHRHPLWGPEPTPQ
jgi:anti-sigma regulatory factor (Ser/Thr protein kinase)